MTRKEWPAVMQRIADEKVSLSTAKNANYAGEDNAWANFDLVEIVTHGKITREQGIFVRMIDKMSRLGSLLFDGQDQVGEAVQDTVKDLAIYADILYASLNEDELSEEPLPTEEDLTKEDESTILAAMRQFFASKS
jgi:hypothetical protein